MEHKPQETIGKKQTIVVTGGAGFIGSHIASRLISEGHKVIILDNLSTGSEKNIPPSAEFINVDLGHESSFTHFEKLNCDAVFHLAGQSSGEASFSDPYYDLRSHVMSTFLLLRWCKAKSINRFIYASSMSIYGEAQYLPVNEVHPLSPKTFYAAAKISAEAYIKLYQSLGINTTILRLFSVYGPGQNLENRTKGMCNIYLSFMLNREPVIIKGSAKRFRDFVYVDDVVDVWLACFNNPLTFGKCYNVGSGEKTTVEDLIGQLKGALGHKEYPVTYKESTPGDQFGLVADIKKITSDLDWRPKTSLREGLRKVVEIEKK